MPSWVLNPESQEYCNQDVSWPAFLFGAQVFLPSVCGCWQNLSPVVAELKAPIFLLTVAEDHS